MADSIVFEGSTLVQRDTFANEICGSHMHTLHYWLAYINVNEK